MSEAQRSDYPAPAPAARAGIDVSSSMQVALTVLALAAMPISAWLYIATYVEAEVDTAIARHDMLLQTTIKTQADKIENLQGYQTQLCVGVRKVDPSFSCLSREQFKYRFDLQRYEQGLEEPIR